MKIFTLELGAVATNTYVIIDGDSAIVVDPADKASAQTILRLARDNHAKIENVLVTHCHYDHIGAVAVLQNIGAKVYVPASDYELLKAADFRNRLSFGDYKTDEFTADIAVTDGDVFSLSNHEIKVLATPGHTPGSVCYVFDDEVIFSGDTLFRLSVGRTDFVFGDRDALERSLRKLFALPHDYDVLPGHGTPTSLYFERDNNPYVD